MDPRAVQYQRNSEILKKYLPEETVMVISEWIIEFDFKLKITKERKTRLGDYTSPRGDLNHTITINYNLNKYAFLITLVHEVAHLVSFLASEETSFITGANYSINGGQHVY